MEAYPSQDSFKILLASDIHLGYAEKDDIRGQDSFNTFEEILQIAVKNEVDFILLGGDLFHYAQPSPYCYTKCIELLRKYCLGDKPISIEFLSDQSYDFRHLTNPIVNYEDPNLNVSLPVFSIHGNHDDPIGHKSVSALDIVANSGLVNYFGKYDNYEKIEISPILLKKGESRLALYGLSHIRDERLGRMFREGKVAFNKMPEDEFWFNIFVLHQNRVMGRGTKNFIPETCLPDFLHLVVWGHEHDCRIQETETMNGVYITQPGSSVATSLAEGEAIQKKVGLLKIHQKTFRIEPIVLRTARPFCFEQIVIEDPMDGNDPANHSEKILMKKVDKIIKEIQQKRRSEELPEMIPLIRLVVFYFNERQIVNHIKFGKKYIGKVANPEDMLIMKPNKIKERRKRNMLNDDDFEKIDTSEWSARVEDVVLQQFRENKSNSLKVLSVKGITEVVKRFVNMEDQEALNLLLNNRIEEVCKTLEEANVDPGNLQEYFSNVNIDEEADSAKDFSHIWKEKVPRSSSTKDDDSNNEEDISDVDDIPEPQKGGKGSRGGRGSRGRARGTKKKEDEVASTSRSAKGNRSRGGRGSRGGTVSKKNSLFE